MCNFEGSRPFPDAERKREFAGRREGWVLYSFAKTPLKAAQAPLAAASASQGFLKIIGRVVLWEEDGDGGRV